MAKKVSKSRKNGQAPSTRTAGRGPGESNSPPSPTPVTAEARTKDAAPAGGPSQAKPGSARIEVKMIELHLIDPNKHNANEMTQEEFQAVVAEVRRLGRPPKPLVVREAGGRYEVVDGEHGLRAAQEAGMAEVPCEVIDADDFEAMLQGYKRNQHGRPNSVKLGRLFRLMMAARDLSHRKLAAHLGVADGTVRNYVAYATAAEVRNRYAPATAVAVVAALRVEQVHQYLQMPGEERDAWLDAGAVIEDPGKQVPKAESTIGDRGAHQEGGDANVPESREADAPPQTSSAARGRQASEADAPENPRKGTHMQPDTPASTEFTLQDLGDALTTVASILSRNADALGALAATLSPSDRDRLARLLRRIGRLVRGMRRTLEPEDGVTEPVNT